MEKKIDGILSDIMLGEGEELEIDIAKIKPRESEVKGIYADSDQITEAIGRLMPKAETDRNCQMIFLKAVNTVKSICGTL